MKRSNNHELFDTIVVGSLGKLGKLGAQLATKYRKGDHLSITNCPMPDVHDADFPRAYAAYNLLRKFDGLNTGLDTETRCIETWLISEDTCRFYNDQQNRSWRSAANASLYHTVMRKIDTVLGDFDPNEFFASIDHSGGASTQRKRRTSAVENKESDNHCVTVGAKRLLTLVQQEMHYYATPTIRNYSRFATVAKDSKTDRPIIIENQGNMLLQKGLGKMIRRRLRYVGIDLNDQSINQRAAANLENCTIDLSAASDSISLACVMDLFPKAWLDVILATRTPFVQLNDGSIHLLEKVGGMGNGFVFELESLLFYCIVAAAIEVSAQNGPVKPSPITVYGDDIIVDRLSYNVCVYALNVFGFTVNELKSFNNGPFRESCGFHYHNEQLITPIYIKHFDGSIGDWYHLYNSLTSLGERIGVDFSKEKNRIKHHLRLLGELNYVPSRYGLRAGLHAAFDEACPATVRRPKSRYKPWVQGYKLRVLRSQPQPYKVCELGAYLLWLRKTHDRQFSNIKFWKGHNRVVIPHILEPLGDSLNARGRFYRVSNNKGPERFFNIEDSVW